MALEPAFVNTLFPSAYLIDSVSTLVADTAAVPSTGGHVDPKANYDFSLEEFVLKVGPDDVAAVIALWHAMNGGATPFLLDHAQNAENILLDEPQSPYVIGGTTYCDLQKAYTVFDADSADPLNPTPILQRFRPIYAPVPSLLVVSRGGGVDGGWTLDADARISKGGDFTGDAITISGEFRKVVRFTEDTLDILHQFLDTDTMQSCRIGTLPLKRAVLA